MMTQLGIFFFVTTIMILGPGGKPLEMDTSGYHFKNKPHCKVVRQAVVIWEQSAEFKAKFPTGKIVVSECEAIKLDLGPENSI